MTRQEKTKNEAGREGEGARLPSLEAPASSELSTTRAACGRQKKTKERRERNNDSAWATCLTKKERKKTDRSIKERKSREQGVLFSVELLHHRVSVVVRID